MSGSFYLWMHFTEKEQKKKKKSHLMSLKSTEVIFCLQDLSDLFSSKQHLRGKKKYLIGYNGF